MNQAHSRALRLCRLGIYVSLLIVAGLILAAQTLARAASERSLLLGQQLGSFQAFAGRSTDVVLNGQQLTLHTRMVQRPIADLLNDFAALCKSGSERATAEFGERVASSPAHLAALQRMFVMRDQRADVEGTALCFAGLGDGGLAEMTTRFGRFAQTLELSELGPLRYLYLRKNERGTHVIFVTSSGPLSLARLWPGDESDVEGPDPIPNARPNKSVRFVSARLLEAERGLTMYRSALSTADTLRDYSQKAAAHGFQVLDFETLAGREKALGLGANVDLRVLRRAGDTWITMVVPDGAGSLLSVVQP